MSNLSDRTRKLPGVAKLEGAIVGAIAEERDLPIPDYDN